MAWQVQEAKQKFSQVIRQALDDGPQVVTRHGEEVVVIIAAQEYRRLTATKSDFKQFLLSGPDFDLLELDRARDLPRDIEW
jgi:prevent-host-death family protein